MFSPRFLLAATVLLGAGLALPGMAVRGEAAAPPATQGAAVAQGATFDDVLKLWGRGKHEEALATFLGVDFARRPLFPKGSVFAYSEKEYAALPRTEIDKLQPQLIEGVRPMKALALRVKEAADAAGRRGDKAQAELYRGQLEKCGQALSHPDSLALLKAVGKAITRMAVQSRPGAPE